MEPAEDLPYGDDRSRIYKAAGGGKIRHHLCFVPVHREHVRFLPYADIRYMDARKNGAEVYMEFSDRIVIMTGRNLMSVSYAIGAGTCCRLEAFNPAQRDMPTDKTAPFIDRIEYYTHNGKKEQQTQETKGTAEAH